MRIKHIFIISTVLLLSACGARPSSFQQSKAEVRAAGTVAAQAPRVTDKIEPSVTGFVYSKTGDGVATTAPEPPAVLDSGDNANQQPEAKQQAESTPKDTTKNTAAPDTPAVEQNKTEFDKRKAELLKQDPNVSDIGVVGDFVAQVNKKIDSTDIVGSKPTYQRAKGVYRFLYVGVMNNSKKAKTIDDSTFTLVAADGTTYEPDPKAAIFAKADSILFEKLNPGIEAYGYVAFDMPVDVKSSDVVLRVSDGAKHVDLQLTQNNA